MQLFFVLTFLNPGCKPNPLFTMIGRFIFQKAPGVPG